MAELLHQDVDDGSLEGGTEVGLTLLDEVGILLQLITEGIEEGGLEPAEAIVVAWDVGLAEGKSLRIPFVSKAVDDRATRVTQPHDLRTLIEGFARSIVNGLPDDLHIGGRAHEDDLRVAT